MICASSSIVVKPGQFTWLRSKLLFLGYRHLPSAIRMNEMIQKVCDSAYIHEEILSRCIFSYIG